MPGGPSDPNIQVVSMAVPSVAARPNQGDTGAYLGNALTKLKDPDIDDEEKKEFPLCLLLLKRCR
jgi:hypothetical protein